MDEKKREMIATGFTLNTVPLWHGGHKLPGVRIDDYNVELRDENGFLGDRASKRAFQALMDNWRGHIEHIDRDPLGDIPTSELYQDKSKLGDILLRGDPEAAGILLGAIEDFAAELSAVLGHILDLQAWGPTERIVVGGGFREGRMGELVIGRTGVLLKRSGRDVDLLPIRFHPDEAGLIGCIHLCPPELFGKHDGILAADLGGTNIRVGVVEFGPDESLSSAKVWQSCKWRHADHRPNRHQAVGRLVSMVRDRIEAAQRSAFHLAPFLGIACPGVIREDGSIERGAQNLPGDWEDPTFNVADYLHKQIEGVGIRIHNDAVVQGLSELPRMRDVESWGVVTIGTGLGNAHFTKGRGDTGCSATR
jgi:ROK family